MRAASHPLVTALAFALAGCASVPSAPPTSVLAAVDQPFAIDGRMSARRGKEAVAVSFAWTHSPPRDELVVTTPLGGALAELTGDTSLHRVEVRAADGRTDVANDWTTLMERTVGFPVPVEALASWTQGGPRAEGAHSAELDAGARVSVLRQDGCELVYGYADDAARRPSRLHLTCHDLELRIVIDRWRDS